METSTTFLQGILSDSPSVQYDIYDYDTQRQLLFDNVKSAVEQRFPLRNERYTLKVGDVGYSDKDDVSLKAQKEAILKGGTVARRLQGRWELYDNATNQLVSKTNKRVIMRVPYLTERGTFIRNGHEMVVQNIMRLIPGVYTRKKANGLFEAHVNVQQGSGDIFKVMMNPDNGVFSVVRGGRQLKLYPILQAYGIPDEQLEQEWGKPLLDANKSASLGAMARRSMERQFGKEAQETPPALDQPTTELPVPPVEEDEEPPKPIDVNKDIAERMRQDFGRMIVDPSATSLTLGKPYSRVDGDMLLTTASKLLRLSRGQAQPDNRDSLEYQRLYGAPELFADRVVRDGGRVAQRMLWKATNKGNLDFVHTGALEPYMDAIFTESRLAKYVEGSSPMDLADRASSVTRIGEGGISSTDAVPIESRLVQHSFAGFIDPVRGPESLSIGIDTYLANGVRKGNDGLLYTKMLNNRTGKPEWVSSHKAAVSRVSTADQMLEPGNYVSVFDSQGTRFEDKKNVDYVITNPERMFGLHSVMIPFKSNLKGMRLLMSSKYSSQAMPLVNREPPLVQNADETGSIDESIGRLLGVRNAPVAGTVKSVNRDSIVVTGQDGRDVGVELYDDFPVNQKGYLRNIPQVKPGDKVKQGDLLASTNYTDNKGVGSLGMNLRVAYIPWRGINFEDGIVVSESAAKRLTSEHMYKTDIQKDKALELGKNQYMAAFPGKFSPEQLAKIGENGMPKPGTVLSKGDPIMLAVKRNIPGPGSMGRQTVSNMSEIWDHDVPGVVTEALTGKESHTVFVRANAPMVDGDKLAGRSGNKGVVTVLPDAEMPKDSEGRPVEVLMSPLGLITRTNPSQILEAMMGKVAAKTGKPVVVPSFSKTSTLDWVEEQLRKNGLSDTEDLEDPETGRKIPKVMTGVAYFYKLKHTAEAKESGRGSGEQYTLEDLPGSGGYGGSKRIGLLEQSALMGHGVMDFVRDNKLIRGQRNDEFWRDFRMGRTPVMPGEPLVNQKFYAHLQGAGINIRRQKDRVEMFGASNRDMDELTQGREVRSTDTFNAKTFEPMDGGLFGSDVFGPDGNQWGFIQLDEPVPNPIMEDSLRRILKMKLKDFRAVAAGQQELDGERGGASLVRRLEKVDVKAEMRREMENIRSEKGQKRDDAVKRYRALASMNLKGLEPKDFMLSRIPVIPPMFRPITTSGTMTMVSDSNYLYKQMLDARNDLRVARESLPDEAVQEARGRLYDNFRQLIGIDDPDDIKLRQKNVGGLLQWVFGKNSPKTGGFQARVISTAEDMVGRGTVLPNPSLKLNQIGLPEEQAWSVYEPFIVRQLVGGGYPTTDAIRMVADRNPVAREAMKKAVETRPVVMTRAPVLHKYGMMGFWPVLIKGSTIQVSPSIVEPFNMDFDGDNANFHVPVSQAAVKAVVDRMLPERNLLNVRKFSPHYLPIREYLQGLHLATRLRPGVEPVKFRSAEEAKQAYAEGRIAADTPVRIG